jgi:hippurate hydrolase
MDKDIEDLLPALVALRRDLHAHPELAFEERRTSSVVAAALRDCGLEVHEGIGGTGVVGVLRRGNSTRMVGLRADMDALPMREDAERSYASRHPGVHHGCGHDGHTAMLLGAARQLARAGRFDGSIAFIFQVRERLLETAYRQHHATVNSSKTDRARKRTTVDHAPFGQ